MPNVHFGNGQPTTREQEIVEQFLLEPERATHALSERVLVGGPRRATGIRHLLLPGLWALQDSVGWVSPGGLKALCDSLGVPLAEAYGVATFYELLQSEPPPEVLIRQCDDITCMLFSSGNLGVEGSRVGSSCLGQCDSSAAAVVQRPGHGTAIVTESVGASTPVVAAPAGARLLRRIFNGGATTIADYRSVGGYTALEVAIEIGSSGVLGAIQQSGLRGRGGAAFPTGAKWLAVADSLSSTKYVIANADESEPGTFKDRVLMEQDPFALIEALTIAGLTVGADCGWIYIRGEYTLSYARIKSAISEAHSTGFLGADVAGSGRPFDIEVRRGGGAYVCGEETALLQSIEGYRGEPRSKPPYPTSDGLFGQPTLINNVETLVNVLEILHQGPAEWRSVGSAESPGTRLFCLSGHVARPGVYEHPMGTTLGRVLSDAGGVAAGSELQIILLGGAAGGFVSPEQLHVELSFEGARSAGLSLGSGAIVVFDASVDLPKVVARVAKFFANESCGKCVPCRIGTQRQMEIVAGRSGGLRVLDDLDQVMTDSSICGLGQAASSLVRSARNLGVI